MWEQTGENPHSVTSEDDGTEFDSHPNCSFASTDQCMSQGDTFSYTFDEPGTYPYFCRIHEDVGMTGTIEVSAGRGHNDHRCSDDDHHHHRHRDLRGNRNGG